MKIGLNPDREDGTWPTETTAWVAFAMQFAKMCEGKQTASLWLRLVPELKEVRTFEEDMPRYVVVGRFEWAHPPQPKKFDPGHGFM